MKPHFIVCIGLIFWLWVPPLSHGQEVEIQYDSATGQLKAKDGEKIPFDQPLTFEIVDAEIQKVQVFYCITDPQDPSRRLDTNDYKKWKHYRFFENGTVTLNESGYKYVNTFSAYNGRVRISIPPLHVKERYSIRLEIIKKIKLADGGEKLRKEVAEIVADHFSYKGPIVGKDKSQELYDNIQKSIVDELETNIVTGSGVEVKSSAILLDTGNVGTLIRTLKIKELNDDLRRQRLSICSFGAKNVLAVLEAFQKNKTFLKSKLDQITAQKESQNFLKAVVNKSVDEKTSHQQIIQIMRSFLDEDNLCPNRAIDFCDETKFSNELHRILGGGGKIQGNLIIEVSDFDLRSGKLMLATLLNLRGLRDKNGAPFFNEVELKKINLLIQPLRKWMNAIVKLRTGENELKTCIETFPFSLNKYYIEKISTPSVTSKLSLFSKATPYIGVDFGLAVAPEIGSTFAIQSFNFHARPVNKQARLSQSRGWDYVLKQASFTVGIAQRIGNYNDNFVRVGDWGSPFVGVGWRANRFIRFSGSYLWYREGDENPII
ncbi:MAG: hypothetical protein AAF135_17210 [Bacteroidota bacterium]